MIYLKSYKLILLVLLMSGKLSSQDDSLLYINTEVFFQDMVNAVENNEKSVFVDLIQYERQNKLLTSLQENVILKNVLLSKNGDIIDTWLKGLVRSENYSNVFAEAIELLTCVNFERSDTILFNCRSSDEISMMLNPFIENDFNITSFRNRQSTYYSILSSPTLLKYLVSNGFDPYSKSFSKGEFSFFDLLLIDTAKHFKDYEESDYDSLWRTFFNYRLNYMSFLLRTFKPIHKSSLLEILCIFLMSPPND